MSLITQYSRLSHHTVAVSGLTGSTTFTVPSNEDFTNGSWTIYDLALSEIGVDELRNQAYIRIGNTVNKISLYTGSTSDSIWTTGSTGVSSIKAINSSTTNATGDYSLASGRNTLASGDNSFVHGYNSVASGQDTIVLGSGITGTTNDTLYTNNLVIGSEKQFTILSGASNSSIGIVTLTGGTATVSTSKVASNSVILLTVQGGTLTNVGSTYISARSVGTSFTITSTNVLDSSIVGWVIINQS
jgi:hypothetical protein